MDVRELTSVEELHTASALLAAIWRPTDPMPFEMLRVIRHIGGYIGGAFEAGTMIGACAAFPTADGGLHSHITGVALRGRGVGFAIKRHQREWALAHGITTISWTFDPLVRRNAYFNLAKLAARVAGYEEDFYGEMSDELNVGDPSDRLIVSWELNRSEVAAAMAGAAEVWAEPRDGVAVVLDEDRNGRPRAAEPDDHPLLAIGTPADIGALRAYSPERAVEWRFAQRAAFAGALACGRRVTGITRSGHYLLERAP